MNLSRICQFLILLLVSATPMLATTWYVRKDGGTRYSEHARSGQCDGKGDAAYPGKGVNQHCAFGDYRYLYDDQHTYPAPAPSSWAISGGDTVIIDNTKEWRVGHQQGAGPNDPWCQGTGGPVCFNPVVPAGTATQHTRILGRAYQGCQEGKKTQLYGGYGVWEVLNLSSTQYVDVECIEVTTHGECIVHASPNPDPCHTTFPMSDYASDGIAIDSKTNNVLLQDVYIHGVTDSGIKGHLDGAFTLVRTIISTTGSTGINFDDGNTERDSPTGVLKMSYSGVNFAGCNQEYPASHTVPVRYCFDQNSATNGDGLGTANTGGIDLLIDHSQFFYNTEDCIDPGHVDTGRHTLVISDSLFYGCSGASYKWGPNFISATVTNNLSLANCSRMSAPLNGAPATYNKYLSLFCRAGDGISLNFRQGGTALLANNTIVTYAPTALDIDCWDSSCSKSVLKFINNLVFGYDRPSIHSLLSRSSGPAGFYFGKSIGTVIRRNNLYHGIRNIKCPTGSPGERCDDPRFTSERTFSKEEDLDNFNFHLSSSSPAIHAGIDLPALRLDYDGKPRTGNSDIGALQH